MGVPRDDLAGTMWHNSAVDYAAFVLHGRADGLHPAPLAAPGAPCVDGYWANYTCSLDLAIPTSTEMGWST